jgi:hypothetical protein
MELPQELLQRGGGAREGEQGLELGRVLEGVEALALENLIDSHIISNGGI